MTDKKDIKKDIYEHYSGSCVSVSMRDRDENFKFVVEKVDGVDTLVKYLEISEKYDYDFNLPPQSIYRHVIGPVTVQLARDHPEYFQFISYDNTDEKTLDIIWKESKRKTT
ncbi:hypothetical protein RLOatenuis_2840 [Rickettsiales bacterium]|nr:hypothetical protein RLOatenuis_2840 [Rickettsiales bacterium]